VSLQPQIAPANALFDSVVGNPAAHQGSHQYINPNAFSLPNLGVNGPYRVVANEVAIGMTMPKGIVELCRMRLTPSAFTRSLSLAAPFSGAEAVAAGFFDDVVDEAHVLEHATSSAHELTKLHRDSFIATKRRVRAEGIAAVRRGFEADSRERAMMLGA